MDRVDAAREKFDGEKFVKRTSIRRNSQLRTLCGDVSHQLKTCRAVSSPLSSSVCSGHGANSSRRREDRTASPRSPWQHQPHVDRDNTRSPKDGADMETPRYPSNLPHTDGSCKMAPSASPPRPLKIDLRRHATLAGQIQDTFHARLLGGHVQDTPHTRLLARQLQDTPHVRLFGGQLQDTPHSRLLARQLQDTPHGRLKDIRCQVDMMTANTAQSSSNNSFCSYVQQELTKCSNKRDHQPCPELPAASSTERAGTQARPTVLQGWVTHYVSPQENKVSVEMNCPQGKHNHETNEHSVGGTVRRMSSGICISTSVSSDVSAHSSSSHKHVQKYKTPDVSTNTHCNRPWAGTKSHGNNPQPSWRRPTHKSASSLPREHILTRLTGRSPPQMPPSFTLGTFSARNRHFRSPQQSKSPENNQKGGSNTYLSRRGLHVSPAEAAEVNAPSVLYKSRDALLDYSYPFSQEAGTRYQRPVNKLSNKENHYCTYLHQDGPGQLHVNCQQYKKLVSKETQYSDTDNLAGKLTTPAHNSKFISSVQENGSSTLPSGDGNVLPGKSQMRSAADGRDCATTARTAEATDGHSPADSSNEAVLQRDDDVDKSSDRGASGSSHAGFKCDSLLKEILKAVTSKIARPAFENLSHQGHHAGHLSKASDETVLESCADTIKTEHDTDTTTCLFSKQSNKYTNPNQTSQRHTSKSSGSYSQSHEPSSEHSTVSLEVKSVNLCFRCSNKNADNSSSQQIKIKWTTSPNAPSKWKAECTEVTSLSDRPEQLASSLTESPQKLHSREISHKNSEYNAPGKQTETRLGTATAAADEVTKSNGAVEPASTTYKVTSPHLVFPHRATRLLAMPSDTTLTSPSPCRSNKSKGRRIACKRRDDKCDSSKILSAAAGGTARAVTKAELCLSPDHSPQMVTGEEDVNKCLHQRNSSMLLTNKVGQAPQNEIAYRHKCAAKVLARNPEDSLVPRIEDRYLLMQLDWGVFIIIVTTIPVLLLLLSLNFYVRASTTTAESTPGTS